MSLNSHLSCIGRLLQQNLGGALSSTASSWLGCKVSLEDRKIEKMKICVVSETLQFTA
jgi:hypothetical protein